MDSEMWNFAALAGDTEAAKTARAAKASRGKAVVERASQVGHGMVTGSTYRAAQCDARNWGWRGSGGVLRCGCSRSEVTRTRTPSYGFREDALIDAVCSPWTLCALHAQGRAGDESTLMANWASWKAKFGGAAVASARNKEERLRSVGVVKKGVNLNVKRGLKTWQVMT
jgi:hypothetical protein